MTPGSQEHVRQGGWQVCRGSGLAVPACFVDAKADAWGEGPPGSRARWMGVGAWRPGVLTGRPPCLPQVSRTALLVALLRDEVPRVSPLKSLPAEQEGAQPLSPPAATLQEAHHADRVSDVPMGPRGTAASRHPHHPPWVPKPSYPERRRDLLRDTQPH